jgi:hypothetical protein
MLTLSHINGFNVIRIKEKTYLTDFDKPAKSKAVPLHAMVALRGRG